MKNMIHFLLTAALIFNPLLMANARGRIQNEDVKSLAEIQSVVSVTGTLTSGSACVTSPSSLVGLSAGLYAYDATVGTRIPSGTTITAIPGTCAAGQIQLSANAVASGSGDTINFGGQASQLINDSKLFVTANGINDLMSNAISNGQLGGSGGGVGTELLTNPGFESGAITSGWTTSGGTAALISSGVNLIAGNKTASWTATATSQTFSSAALPLKGLAGGNCSASIGYLYSGSASDYSVRVIDGSSNVLSSQTLPQSSPTGPANYANSPLTITFPCGLTATSTVQLQLISNVASPSIIYFDNMHLGSLGLYTFASSPNTPTIQTFTSGNGTYTPTSSSVKYVRVRMIGAGGAGSATAAGVSGPGGGAGCYGEKIITSPTVYSYTVGVSGGADTIFGPLTAGTGLSGVAGAPGGPGGTCAGPFDLTATGARGGSQQGTANSLFFSGFGASGVFGGGGYSGGSGIGTGGAALAYGSGGGGGANGGAGGAGASGYIEVTEYYGLNSNSAVSAQNALDTLGQIFYVATATCPANSIIADGSNISTSYPALAARLGSTTVPDLRGVFVRGAGTNGTSLNGKTVAGTLGALQGDATAKNGLSDSGHVHSFIEDEANAGSPQYNQFSSNTGTNPSAHSGSGGIQPGYANIVSSDTETRPANVALTPCISTSSMSAPILIGGLTTSNTTGSEVSNRASVDSSCTSTPCTIATQSGSWLTSISRSTTGSYTANIAAGVFSGEPTCQVGNGNLNNLGRCYINGTPTSTSVPISCSLTTTAALLDMNFYLSCQGPR